MARRVRFRFAPARPSVAGRSLLPEQCSGSTLRVDRRSSIHSASNIDFGARHPWCDAFASVSYRPGHPWPVVRSYPSSARVRRCASTVAHPLAGECKRSRGAKLFAQRGSRAIVDNERFIVDRAVEHDAVHVGGAFDGFPPFEHVF